jgi:uncharacterized repeat protein (TIGR01451 family)
LSVIVTALTEPVKVGKEVTYVVEVRNDGKSDESQVALKVTLPPELVAAQLHIFGPTRPAATSTSRTIEFLPLARLGPGESQQYRVGAAANKAGNVSVRAELTSPTLREPVVDVRPTTIIEN